MAIYSLILQLQTRGTISVTWKKTALPVLVCLGLLTLFCSCNSYSDDSLYRAILGTDGRSSPLVEYHYPAGIPRTVSEMPETAALIVRGTFLDDAQGDITYLDEVLDLGRGAAPGERSVLSAQTTSTFEITKVIQGDLQVGDQIKISEPYYVDNQDGVETIKRSPGCSELYAPSEPGKEYLFFFDDPFDQGEEAGIYFPLWNEFGRYPVIYPLSWDALSIPSMTNEELNLGEGDASVYKDVYRQVVKKFMW